MSLRRITSAQWGSKLIQRMQASEWKIINDYLLSDLGAKFSGTIEDFTRTSDEFYYKFNINDPIMQFQLVIRLRQLSINQSAILWNI